MAQTYAVRGQGATPALRGEHQHRRTAAYVGLALIGVLLVESGSGWLLWVAAHRQAPLAAAFLDALVSVPADWTSRPLLRWLFDIPSVTNAHVWFGYLLLGLTWLKPWAVW